MDCQAESLQRRHDPFPPAPVQVFLGLDVGVVAEGHPHGFLDRIGNNHPGVLAAVDQDYELSLTMHRRLRAAVRTVAASPELRDMTDLSRADLADRVLAILRTIIRFDNGLKAKISDVG